MRDYEQIQNPFPGLPSDYPIPKRSVQQNTYSDEERRDVSERESYIERLREEGDTSTPTWPPEFPASPRRKIDPASWSAVVSTEEDYHATSRLPNVAYVAMTLTLENVAYGSSEVRAAQHFMNRVKLESRREDFALKPEELDFGSFVLRNAVFLGAEFRINSQTNLLMDPVLIRGTLVVSYSHLGIVEQETENA